MKAGDFDWSVGDRLETLTRLYLVEELSATEIAALIGQGCDARTVIRKANRSGLSKQRPPEVTYRQRLANVERARPLAEVVNASRRASRPSVVPVVSHLGEGRGLPPDVRAAIDAAVAAGKVTILPPAPAAGLTSYERWFHAARPAPPVDPAAHARALRAGRKSALSAANRIRAR